MTETEIYQSILDRLPLAVCAVDGQYRYTAFNSRHAERMRAQYGANIQTGGSLLDSVTDPRDRQEMQRNLDRALAGETVSAVTAGSEDGRSRVHIQHTPCRDADGAVTGVCSVCQAVTEREQAGLELLVAVPPGDTLNLLSRAASRQLSRLTVSHRLDSGEIRPVEVYPRPIAYQGSQAVMAVAHDITEQRQAEQVRQAAEQALQAKEAELLALVESLPALVWSARPDGTIDFCNQAWLAFTGMSLEQIYSGGWTKALHPDDVPATLARWDEATRNQAPYEVEQRMRGADGEYRWFLVRARPALDSAGQVIRWYGTNTDITGRKQAEEKLARAEYRYRMLAENSPDVIYIIDLATFKTLYLNRDTLFGYTRQEMEADGSLLSRVHPDDIAAVKDHWQKVMSGADADADAVEYRLQLKDGRWEWLSSRGRVLFRDAAGKPSLLQVTLTPITARKQAEQTLRESEARFSAVFRASPIGINVFRLSDGRSVDVNGAFVDLTGYSRRELLSHTAAELNLFADPAARPAWMPALRREGIVRNVATTLRTKSGALRRAVASMVTFEMHGEPLVMVLAMDVTAMERAREELDRFFNLVPDMVCIASTDGYFKKVNAAWERSLGYTRDELLARPFADFIHPDDRAATFKEVERQVQGQAVLHFVNRYLARDGAWRWLEWYATPSPDGATLYAAARDITERRREQALMAEALEFNRQVLQASPIGMTVYNAAGQCIAANPASARITGASVEAQLQENYHQFDSWKRMGLYDAALRALETNQPVSLQSHGASAAGRDVWVNAIFTPLKLADATHLLMMFEDDSERQKAELALAQSNRQLAGLVDSLERSSRNADLLRQLGELLQVCATEEEAQAILERYGADLAPGTGGGLFLSSLATRQVTATATWGRPLVSEPVFRMTDCWALRRNHLHLVSQAQVELDCAHMPLSFGGSYLDLPLTAGGETLGLLHVEWPSQGNVSPEEQGLMRMLAENISLSLSNIRLRRTLQEQSERDPLTGAFNRRHLEDTLNRELPRALRRNQTIGVIMLDIDHFKQVNDVYGHVAGDIVLVRLAALLKSQAREDDIVCRMGGEEFVLLLPGMNSAAALERAESIRAAMADQRIESEGRLLGAVTISLGVAIFPQHGTTGADVLSMADRALYRAKSNGRNRVELA